MKLKIISWNVKGLNDKEKGIEIRGLIREWKANIVCFQETKVEGVTRDVVRSFWGCHHMDWFYLGLRGA